LDGSEVGSEEGSSLWRKDGSIVGELLMLKEGSSDGLSLRFPEGDPEGCDVGAVGEEVGAIQDESKLSHTSIPFAKVDTPSQSIDPIFSHPLLSP